MEKDVVIKAEGLSKLYQLGQAVDLSRNFREALSAFPRKLARLARGKAQRVLESAKGAGEAPLAPLDPETPPGTFWALRDVNFEIKRGEVVGIIGRNGAGKSTLLKVLSRITAPTKGYAEIRGRLASLLEVGTGFHPELTGRENIYLNGAILGMRKAEIEAKFDEIVAFAEVEKFLDTPVKRYSSGMYVRLAFAVAAHLDPEILIVDEVLAVGDAAFQKKCLGRMNDVARGGRTVLFVSHNMAAIEGLCNKAMLLSHGSLQNTGGTGEIIREFFDQVRDYSAVPLRDRKDRQGSGRLRFTGIRLELEKNQATESLVGGKPARILLSYEADGPLPNAAISIGFYSQYGQFMLMCQNEISGQPLNNLPARGEFCCEMPVFPFSSGLYFLNIFCEVSGVIADWLQQAYQLTVIDGDFFGTGKSYPSGFSGLLASHEWSLLA